MNMLDVKKINNDFPCLRTDITGKKITYLDSGATTLKPQCVIDSIVHYYTKIGASVHRGVHSLGEQATAKFEGSRAIVSKFLNAKSEKEIVFTSGTTDSMNLLAYTLRKQLKPGDEIIVSDLEHHANIVPWQLIQEETGLILKNVKINNKGVVDMDHLQSLISDRTKIISVIHTSNVLGTTNPVKEICQLASQRNIITIIDGAQAMAHGKVDVQDIGCDFFTFSAHKLFGPTGIGALYGKKSRLESLGPYRGGGDMIDKVSFSETTFNEVPYRLEAGTPNIAGVIGMSTAIEYVNSLGLDHINKFEKELTQYAVEKIKEVPGFTLVGPTEGRTSVLTFTHKEAHPQDIASILDNMGIIIRTGHHCAQPLHATFRIPASARASLSIYNTKDDVDHLIEGLNKVNKIFGDES